MVEKHGTPEEQKVEYNERGLEQRFVDEAVESLFDETRQCDGNFLYMWKERSDVDGSETGVMYYDQAVKTEAYYNRVTGSEIEVFKQNREELKQYIEHRSVENIIELGPGDDNKLVGSLLGSYELGGKRVIPVDIVQKFLDDTERKILELNDPQASENDKIKVYTELKNRFDPELYKKRKGTVVSVGGSIGNSARSMNVEFIETLGVGGKRHALISYFNMPERDDPELIQSHIGETVKMYETAEMEEWVMKGFRALGLDTAKLEYAVEYVSGDPDMIRMGAKVKKGETLEYKIGGKTLIKKGIKGEEGLWSITSRRYTKGQFDGMVEEGGAKVTETYRHGPMSLAVIETPNETVKQKRQKIDWEYKRWLYGVLGGLLLLTAGAKWSKWHHKSQENKRVLMYVMDKVVTERLRVEPFGVYSGSPEDKLEYITERVDELMGIAYEMYPDLRSVKQNALSNSLMICYANYYVDLSQSTERKLSDHELIVQVWIPELIDNAIVVGSSYSRPYAFLESITSELNTVNQSAFEIKSIDQLIAATVIGNGIKKIKVGELKNGDLIWFVDRSEVGRGMYLISGNEETGYSTDIMNAILEEYREFGYARVLTNNILSFLDLSEPDPQTFSVILQRTIALHKDGYDFSYLAGDYHAREMKLFISWFFQGVVFEDPCIQEVIYELIDEIYAEDHLLKKVALLLGTVEKKYFKGETGSNDWKKIRSVVTRMVIKDFVGSNPVYGSRWAYEYNERNMSSWIEQCWFLFDGIEGMEFSDK